MSNYQKFMRDNAVISAGLLGSYNDNDKYLISQDVAEELAGTTKLLTFYKENEARCETQIDEHKFNFKIKFMIDSVESKKYASLYLQEGYKLFGKTVELETFVVSFKDVDDNEYLGKLKSAFKLVTKDESEGKDIKNSSPKIDKIIKDKKTRAKFAVKELMFANRQYVNEVLKVMKKSGPYGAKVQKLLKDKLANINLDKTSPEYWAQIKALLDEILEETKDECPEEVKKWMELINQNYVQLYMLRTKDVKTTPTKKAPVVKGKSKPGKKKAAAEVGKSASFGSKKKPKKKEAAKQQEEEKKHQEPVRQQTNNNDKNKPTGKEESIFNTSSGYNQLKQQLEKSDIRDALAAVNGRILNTILATEIGNNAVIEVDNSNNLYSHKQQLTETGTTRIAIDQMDQQEQEFNSKVVENGGKAQDQGMEKTF